MQKAIYKRILLKLSGEDLLGEKKFGIDPKVLQRLADEIDQVRKLDVEIAIVIGGGNIFRGVSGIDQGFDQVTGDQMGMLATLINSLALQTTLENRNIHTRLLSAIRIEEIAEPYIRRRAIRHLEKGRVIILGAGTGHPYFTTDTAAALRAVEIKADVILKGTRVEGVYDSDPEMNANAIKYTEINFLDVLKKGLKVMDLTAVTLCQENKLPIIVFNMNKHENLKRLLLGEKIGTIVNHEVKTN
ncbi:MAG: UMP kinase [Bacteroidetes bacterium]|nr:UMP kinase [Bacteroidota bacterium]MBU2584951.1 UMP kinase [Bacteroidota bacterium]